MSNALDFYAREVTAIETLNLREEQKLFELIKKGNEEAREKMIVSNLRLVIKIAHEFENMGLSFEDLVCVGNIGLIKAVDKFELGKGAKFSTYAAMWIKQYMRRELDKSSRIVSFCGSTLKKMKKIKQMKEEQGNQFTIDKAAEVLGSGKGFVTDWANGYSQISLNEKTLCNDNAEIGDTIADDKTDVASEYCRNDFLDFLENNYETLLDEKEQKVIRYRYGICGGDKTYTQKETAKLMDYTYQRIQQIEKVALKKLRDYFEKNA